MSPPQSLKGERVNTKRIVSCSLAAWLLAPMLALANPGDADSSHPTHWVKDSAITAAIKTKLASEHLSSLGDLQVKTDMSGVVWLSGTARSKREADRAVAIARSTDGVVRVKNDIVVQPEER
jgi:hyperosmotically inducible periplasmic protein